MVVGLLWYDDDKKADLSEKVLRAVEHYRLKHGRIPEVCFVNPKLIPAGFKPLGGLEVCADARVLPNHFWLGFKTVSDHPRR